ncbi:hypothetical protein [Hymenobacter volaticus]|uniref:Uncharacterized protein n=1 Tax=Hymenobacter volaticus TaxID=2932254 RepID=A0ABY4G7M2_9BACT|nr:hypothetical protein [Hymenobacter volaticus]UOQ66791.1 hypothetical protein MUN86_02395 [Hymenobacter volaticus]
MRFEASKVYTANAFTSSRMLVATVVGAELAWHHRQGLYLLRLRYTNNLAPYHQRHYANTDTDHLRSA